MLNCNKKIYKYLEQLKKENFSEMKVAYKKRQLTINLVLGLIWLGLFVVSISQEKPNWTDYGYGIIAIVYLCIYLYQKRYKYVNIKNGIISLNGPFGKKLLLTDIKQIKEFAGDYILKSDTQELRIDTRIIDVESLEVLNAELKKLNIEWKGKEHGTYKVI